MALTQEELVATSNGQKRSVNKIIIIFVCMFYCLISLPLSHQTLPPRLFILLFIKQLKCNENTQDIIEATNLRRFNRIRTDFFSDYLKITTLAATIAFFRNWNTGKSFTTTVDGKQIVCFNY